MTKTINISANPSQPCTFASRTSHHTDQSLQKSMSAPTQDQNDRQISGRKEARLPNMRLASCGVQWLNSSSVFQLEFCGRLTVLSSEIPHERQAQNR
ncbi:hypothetical protein [Petrimonas sulfuriphila]|uniref:hypothetical protein n=1 Tax=Petrimonas sulfuriphila TaxID=285070 RepID=UPI003EBD6A70